MAISFEVFFNFKSKSNSSPPNILSGLVENPVIKSLGVALLVLSDPESKLPPP